MRNWKQASLYVSVLAAAFVLAMAASWSEPGALADGNAYDWMFRLLRPSSPRPQTVVLAIDEETLQAGGGVRRMRTILAAALERLRAAEPRAVAVDLVLADPGEEAEDQRLEDALRATARAVLACDLLPRGGAWEDPLPRFRRAAAGTGHVHAEPDPVSREVLLHKVAGRDRRWALALETYRAAHGVATIEETPDELHAGPLTIPASNRQHRALLIRYRPPEDPIPVVSAAALQQDPQQLEPLRGKVVFVGVTAISAAKDRLPTPYSGRAQVAGVEINASVYETLAHGLFLKPAPGWTALTLSVAVVVLTGVSFWWFSGWTAYALGASVLLAAHALPLALFSASHVLSFTMPVFSAWFSAGAAAGYQYFVVRRGLLQAEGERQRYQQAMHFVVHEMRTPLTAIQGSSELMGRYPNLPEEKRKQIAALINSESKRMGRMIRVFLDVERLGAGQMELKREVFEAYPLMETCVERARALADRKRIRVELEPFAGPQVAGDRELMEYAFYNLLTNAVKYSPADTEVRVYARRQGDALRISVRDQGMGMDAREVKEIFRRFYRTKRAEESGEAGTGIGLSIVQQIVTQHGGTIEVESSPGEGSCFTLVIPACREAGAPA
jgi:signal transduction histidine kinase